MVYYACFFFTGGLVDTVHPVAIYGITASCDSLSLEFIPDSQYIYCGLNFVNYRAYG